jgi:hypothetical protein
VACIAMVTGSTYPKVFASIAGDPKVAAMMPGKTLNEVGIPDPVMEYILQREGFWLRTEYAVRCADWPPKPFGQAHICQVVMPRGSGHWVTMDDVGIVLDPLHEGIYSLNDHQSVNKVIGLIREGEVVSW